VFLEILWTFTALRGVRFQCTVFSFLELVLKFDRRVIGPEGDGEAANEILRFLAASCITTDKIWRESSAREDLEENDVV
jgi:hypothetical protein